jgi:hypothetical protein
MNFTPDSGATDSTFKHPKGAFPRLTSYSFPSWKNNMTRLLIAMEGWEITNSQEKIPPLPTAHAEGAPTAEVIAYEAKLEKATDKQINYKRRKNDAAAARYNTRSICDGAYRYGPCRQESRISTR